MRIIHPVGHRLLVKPMKVGNKSARGLYIPESAVTMQQKATIYGELVEVGPNAWKAFDDGKPWGKPGQEIVFAKYGGMVVEDEEGNEFRIINDEDMYAYVEQVENTPESERKNDAHAGK